MAVCDCSIVILAHNGKDFTRTCLESVLRSADLPRELFLVDNASTDATPELVEAFAPLFRQQGVRFVTWRNRENKGCSLARNEAWEQATATWTLFMDNDTAVCTPDWLSRLQGYMTAHPDTALTGPKLIYPYRPHPVQCAGVSFNPLGRVCFRGRGDGRGAPPWAQDQSVHALISACWIMRTDLRDTVGMLDELFHPVQYEDLDLCLRARDQGWDVRYTPSVEIYHFEGITTASFGQKEYRRNIVRNSSRFRQRWQHCFPQLPPDPQIPGLEFRWLERDELGLEQELDLSQTPPEKEQA
jgi:GT2 family glycosyltransferase